MKGGSAPSGWVNYKDPMGFTVQFPQGWKAQGDRASGRIQLQGPAGEQIIVWPVFLSGALTPQSAASVLQRLAPKFWPDAQWERPQPVGATAVRARGRTRDRVTVSSLAWVASPKGNAGYIYALAAPSASYRAMEETFARILQSVQVVGGSSAKGPGAAPAPTLTYVKWQDPREQAFSLEVPAQWKASGGTFRFASVDVRPAWSVVSPDGQILIAGGDAELPAFTIPNPMLTMTGFTEGRWYSAGYGVNMLVRRYTPGTAFAKEYVTQKAAARGCSELTFTEVRDRPDLVQAINAINAQYGLQITQKAGEVAFTCRQKGQMMNGYYFASTQLLSNPGGVGGLWTVPYLGGYLAPSGRVAEAQAVFDHIVKSIAINPQWAAMQQNVTMNTSKIVSQTNQEISKIINDSYWNRQRTMDEISRRRSNAILGVVDVIDPVTGRELKVESGSNYYWIDHRGTIVGTQTDTRPNLDFREMIRLP